jgi:hypothetical protein
MMNIFRASMCLGLLACSQSLAQDLYRCDHAGRRVVYQGSECEIGVQQRAIDPSNARREQIRKSQEQEREQRRLKSAAGTTAG